MIMRKSRSSSLLLLYMAGIKTDYKFAAVTTPGDGRPKELGAILDRDNNGYFNDVYVYTTNGTRRAIGDDFDITTISATSTTTQKRGTIRLAGAATTITIPTPTTGTDDGLRLHFINATADAKSITAGANNIFDLGDPSADNGVSAGTTPAQRTTMTLTGIGATATLVAIGGKWFTAARTLNGGATISVAYT